MKEPRGKRGEAALLVRAIRDTEKMLGSPRKSPSPAETGNMAVARKSLIAARDIAKGDVFSAENLTCKRPGNALSPMRYWDYLGKKALRDFAKDEPVE